MRIFIEQYFGGDDKPRGAKTALRRAVIDERWNQGGSIADYVIDLLARPLLGYFNNPIGEKQPWTAPNGAIFVADMPALEISATDIRRRCAEGKSVRYPVPDGVANYINTNSLYRTC